MGSLKRLFISPRQRHLPALLLLLSFFCRHLMVSAQEPYRMELKYPDVSYNIYAGLEKRVEMHSLMQKAKSKVSALPDSATVLFIRALEIAHDLNDLNTASNIFSYLAKIYEEKPQFPRAIYLQSEAIRLRKESGDSLPFDLFSTLAQYYFLSGNYRESIAISHKMHLPFDSAHSYYPAAIDVFAGHAYIHIGKPDSASYLFLQALEKWPALNAENAYYKCMALSGMAQTANDLKNTEKATQYLNRAILIARTYKDTLGLVNLLSSKIAIYNNEKKYEEAIALGKQNMSMVRAINNQEAISLTAYNLAGILINSGKYEEGLQFAQECFDASLKTPSFWVRINANYVMGYAFVKLQQYGKAIPHLLPAITLAEEKNYISNISDAYGILATAYAGTGNFEKAYEYRTRFGQLRDSLRGQENAARIAHVEAKYETAVQKQSLAEQKVLIKQKESKLREKNFWIGGITGGSALLGVLLLTVYRSRSRQQQARLLQVKKEQELDLIKARMETEQEERTRIGQELHDGVVSQLLSIKLSLNALEEEHFNVRQPTLRQIANQLDEATLELRTTAHNLMPEALLRAGLEKAIHSLCEQIQRFSRMEVSFQIYGDIPEIQHEKKLSLYRIIQELIQNVIKHADATQLLVQLSCRDALLALTVEDNGIGLKADSTRRQGAGLANVRRRVEALSGSLDIHSEPGVETTFYMEFDLAHLR